MIDIPLSQNFLQYCRTYALGNMVETTTRAPGSTIMQMAGVIGQNAVLWYFGLPLMHGTGFDGGYDLKLNGSDSRPVLVDVKTQARKFPVSDYMVANFVDAQKGFRVDAYIFTSYNWVKEIVTVMGWMSKDRLFKLAEFHPRGQIRTRNDGSTFENRYDNWEIGVRNLYPATSILQLKDDIVRFSCYLREKAEV